MVFRKVSEIRYSVKRWTLQFVGERPGKLAQAVADVTIEWVDDISSSRFLDLYTKVGDKWNWFDRRMMPADELTAILQSPHRHHASLRDADGMEVGFVEICQHSSVDIEVAYFGLFPEHVGRGLGRSFLSGIILHAHSMLESEGRLWLTTCEWDSPGALPFYQRMGFRVESEDVVQQQTPAGCSPPAHFG